jgi:hypothetical protein
MYQSDVRRVSRVKPATLAESWKRSRRFERYPPRRSPIDDAFETRLAIYSPRTAADAMRLPIAGVLTAYIGCRRGIYPLFDIGVKTVGDLVEKSREDLLTLSGIGAAKVDRIETILARLGLALTRHTDLRHPESQAVQAY